MKNPLSVVMLDERFQSAIVPGRSMLYRKGGQQNLRFFTTVRSKKLAAQKNVILVSKASRLAEVSGFIREINEKNYLKGLFIRPDVKTELLPKLMHESGVSTLKHTFILHQPETLRRVLHAWNLGAPEKLIADASATEDILFVVSCSFAFYRIRFGDLPALRNIASENRRLFEIDEDGSYIHWPREDIHIDIDTLEYHTSEDYRKKADLKKLQYHRLFGSYMKNLREEAGLRQSDIPGLSARQVRRIENGETPVTAGALEKIAAALGMTPEELLDKQTKK